MQWNCDVPCCDVGGVFGVLGYFPHHATIHHICQNLPRSASYNVCVSAPLLVAISASGQSVVSFF